MKGLHAKAVLLVLAVAAVASTSYGQYFTKPSKTPKTVVTCTTCTDSNKNKPSVGYTGAITSYLGRYLDSTYVTDYQGPVRTLRAWNIKYDARHNRVYMRIGSTMAAYDATTFFTQLRNNVALRNADTSGRLKNPVGEAYLAFARSFYAEASGWLCPAIDGQQRLYDFDFDDRGMVYMAYSYFGWGIAKDDYGPTGDVPMPSMMQSPQGDDGITDSAITAIKTRDGRYYAIVGNGGSSSVSTLWDTTDSSHATFIRRMSYGLLSSVHSTDQTTVGFIDGGTSKFYLFTTDALASNGSPTFSLNGPFVSAVTDGTNFYLLQASPGSRVKIVTVSPTGAGYQVTNTAQANFGFDIVVSFNYGAGYFTIAGNESGISENIRVFRVVGSNVQDLELTAYSPVLLDPNTQYFNRFFWNTPSGYAHPSAAYVKAEDAMVLKDSGKTYLLVSFKGIGDVYEVRGADGVTATLKGTGGTANPNSLQASGSGPFYGDPVVFSGSTTAAAALNVTWDFGNPEAADNIAASITGSDVTHQYSGIAAAGISSPRTVTVTNATDSSVTDSVVLTLATPAPRVAIGGTTASYGADASNLPIVAGDTFVDASDGTVEGHYSSWTLDGVTTKGTPTTFFNAGTCGAHTLNFAAHYGPYTGSGNTIVTLGNDVPFGFTLSYTAAPFVALIGPPTTNSTNVVFQSISRQSGDTAELPGGAATMYTYKWDLLDASGNSVFGLPAGTATLAQIPAFSIPKTNFNSVGMKVRLTLTVASTAVAGPCANATSSTALTAPLNAPDPVIAVTTGCQYAGSPCTLTANSASSADQSGWSYSWSITPAGIAGGARIASACA